MKTSLPILALLGLAACAAVGSLDRPDAFVGRTEAELRERLGPPQQSRVQPDGSRLLVYQRSLVVQYGGQPRAAQPATTRSEYAWRTGVPEPASAAASAAPETEAGCSVNFRVDAQGVVRAAEARGRDCSAK
jgi:hypothetical protein